MEDKYQLIFDTINQGVVFRDSEGHIISVNPAAEEFFEGVIKTSNAFPKFLLDDHVQGAIHEDGTSFPVETHPSNRALKSGKKIENVVMGAPHNGEYRWFKVNAIPLFQPGELKPYQVYTVFEDISSLKKSRDALDESKNRYKRISKLVNNYAYSVVITESGKYEYEWVVDSFYNILGVSEGYLKSNKDLMFPVYPEDKDLVRKQFSNLKDGDKRSELIRLLTYDKKVLWVENHIECVEEDGILRVYGAVRDITLRRKYYMELERELEISRSFEHIYTPLISEKSSMEDITSIILERSERITGSKRGYVSVIVPEKNELLMHSHTFTSTKSQVKELDDDFKFHIDDNPLSDFFDASIKIVRGFYTNTPEEDPLFKKIPNYHVPIENAMYVPVIVENEVLGQIVLANSIEGYADKDLETIQRLAEYYAIGIQSMRSKAKIEKSLEDKELLLREIHHRVKNNLQIITSLLNLESQNINNEETEEFYRITQARIKSIALVHQKLYETPEITQINIKEYMSNLIQSIVAIYSMPIDVNLEIDIEESIILNLDTTIPCGLIINELLTNSIKYAFPDNKGSINIKWEQKGEEYILMFSDDGIGLPEDIKIETSNSLGFKLVKSLVDQIDGTIELERTQGTQFTIKFRELEYKKRI